MTISSMGNFAAAVPLAGVLLFAAGCAKPNTPATPAESAPVSVQAPAHDAGRAAVYENTFESAAVGDLPAELFLLDGDFAVRQVGDNRVLQLPGAPLSEFGVQFGPTVDLGASGSAGAGAGADVGVEVSAMIRGRRRGRRMPQLAVGLCGVNGWRLRVNPAAKHIELMLGSEVQAAADFTWQPDDWTRLRMVVRRLSPGQWRIAGKAWPHDAPEPNDWTIQFDTPDRPPTGRASVWGWPYSGQPIDFDDVAVKTIGK